MWGWITKAMLLRGDNETYMKLKKLFSSDQNEEDLKKILEVTENIICRPYSNLISKKNGQIRTNTSGCISIYCS